MAWLQPIHFHPESKAWLLLHENDMPPELKEDLEQVAKLNDIILTIRRKGK